MTVKQLDGFLSQISFLYDDYTCSKEEWDKIFEDFLKNGFKLIGKTKKCWIYFCKGSGCLVVSGYCNIFYYNEDGVYKELVYYVK